MFMLAAHIYIVRNKPIVVVQIMGGSEFFTKKNTQHIPENKTLLI